MTTGRAWNIHNWTQTHQSCCVHSKLEEWWNLTGSFQYSFPIQSIHHAMLCTWSLQGDYPNTFDPISLQIRLFRVSLQAFRAANGLRPGTEVFFFLWDLTPPKRQFDTYRGFLLSFVEMIMSYFCLVVIGNILSANYSILRSYMLLERHAWCCNYAWCWDVSAYSDKVLR